MTGLAVDDQFIYISNYGSTYLTGTGSIGRVNKKNGSDADVSLVGGLTAPWGVAIDAGGPPAPPPFTDPPVVNIPPTLNVSCPGCGTSSGVPRFTKRFQITRDVWAPASAGTPLTGSTLYPVAVGARLAGREARAKVPRGTSFTFSLDRAAKVSVVIRRQAPGRRLGRRCAAPTRRLRKRRACVRLVKAAPTLTRKAHAGGNRMPFTGRIRGRALTPGRYAAAFTATAGGKTSKAATVRFRIVRG